MWEIKKWNVCLQQWWNNRYWIYPTTLNNQKIGWNIRNSVSQTLDNRQHRLENSGKGIKWGMLHKRQASFQTAARRKGTQSTKEERDTEGEYSRGLHLFSWGLWWVMHSALKPEKEPPNEQVSSQSSNGAKNIWCTHPKEGTHKSTE